MASERDLELLDQYISNRLADADKVDFEQKLQSDASLKNEYGIQRRVVEKLRDARVKELKTMFNNVPVAELETTGTSVGTQVALWVAMVGAIGTGVYFYLNNEEKVEAPAITKQEEVVNEIPSSIEPMPDTPKQNSPLAVDESSRNTTEAEVKTKEQEVKAIEPAAPNGLQEDGEPEAPAKLDVFDPSEESDNSSASTPEVKIQRESTPLNKSSILVELDNTNKKYNFHYQFKNGKLYLYGALEKNLYEIMEFFSDNRRTVFLFYKDNYYLLNEANESIKPLSPINDPTLLKKLKDYRGTR
jgi:hypothetical protein